MAKRSSTLKQFLLRVHPDHFRNIPKVYFSVMVPSLKAQESGEEIKTLKRFPLELAANIEAKMISVLRECGVSVDQNTEEAAVSGTASQHRRVKKRGERRPDDWRRSHESGWKSPSGMDFGGFTMDEMYAKANRAAAASASRRRKKPIQTLKGLLEYMKEDETVEIQQRRRIAWQSIQSVRGTLKRELGLEDVLFSCGWSTMHLNTTAMILLQTLRKYTRANKQGIFTPKDFLHGATIDISANPSGIDFSNEYRIVLNPADVPVQWIQVLETIDANMQELAREKQKGGEQDKDNDILDEDFFHFDEKYARTEKNFAWDKKVEKFRKRQDVWSRMIDQVAQMITERRSGAEEKDAILDNQVEESVDGVVERLVPFLQQQKRLIGDIGRENVKLRDMLRAGDAPGIGG
ncbi:Ankyrin-2 [Phytophthora nicotianae]|uniref:Ankyrin-2 n=1 Tax=Phytophthora nicotianae TaxID=4792 RepID=A0A0W8CS85_PHYNI|nr:Ankyrin-2 [Phytophthora nicotianae]